ncbi:SAV_915 family protein [Streptomyces sp. CC224B]|uniref:SAV_915 family protein n=1 Tax=Streptomyces sp. CC224B TaxID=3044571 RepID=UPI0024A97FBD|nr:SAV_915 family protein [Streptomyces sp. CC224B]
MTRQLVSGEDPEPAERGPAGPLFIPVRPGPAGCVARLFRTPLGGRTAVAFTSAQRLTATLGSRQPWIRLSEPALRALTEPLGVAHVTVDPRLTDATPTAPRPSAPATSPVPVPTVAPRRPTPWRERDPEAVAALRTTGATALVGAPTAWLG